MMKKLLQFIHVFIENSKINSGKFLAAGFISLLRAGKRGAWKDLF
jgi:hypothetical protein